MKLRLLSGLALLALITVPASAQTPEQKEIINASFMFAYGRPAADAELADSHYAGKTLAQLIQGHVEDLKEGGELQQQTALSAMDDAFGARRRQRHSPWRLVCGANETPSRLPGREPGAVH
jgi:hypothetical protein